MRIHVIESGDTLWRLARMYDTTITQIALANQITSENILTVGQSLVIPTPNIDYVVEPGDNLIRIAERFGVTLQELMETNNITDPNLIYVGRMLHMPYFYYQVRPGDTIFLIANRYGSTAVQVNELNQLPMNAIIYPGQQLKIPIKSKEETEVNAYTTTFNEQGRNEILALGSFFTYLTPFSYQIREDGSLTPLNDELVLNAAQMTNTSPLLVITNFQNGFNSDLAAAILRNPDVQEILITNILREMEAKGYQGLNIDFEYVYPQDRENYNAFLRRVVERLHPNYSVSTALAPKESREQRGTLYEAHDYQAHGEIVDFVVLMTYEWGWAGGSPLAIAPINKVRDVLNYAVTEIPPEKMLMGVPLYGRDWNIPWVEGTLARTLSPQEAVHLATRYGAQIQYNETYQSPFFYYTDELGQAHEVWFEDARSVQVKYDTVKAYGLRGVSYWVLGNAFPQNWAVLSSTFTIKKK
ncbi:LysM peptidoglycan-binding domain-containing protein [Pseudogracilibacillus sp. SO30301A]|uniref:LysM peptidoglycan-binding domain-containing protein n=1 Tax=Pseudogracilibacillus sp. SO30301A TaxID=3098291 RepID=UPI00300E300C